MVEMGYNHLRVFIMFWAKLATERSMSQDVYVSQVDHLICTVHHLLVNLLPLFLICISVQVWVQRFQGDVGIIHTISHRHIGVTMFPQDPPVTPQWVNPQPSSHQIMELS